MQSSTGPVDDTRSGLRTSTRSKKNQIQNRAIALTTASKGSTIRSAFDPAVAISSAHRVGECHVDVPFVFAQAAIGVLPIRVALRGSNRHIALPPDVASLSLAAVDRIH